MAVDAAGTSLYLHGNPLVFHQPKKLGRIAVGPIEDGHLAVGEPLPVITQDLFDDGLVFLPESGKLLHRYRFCGGRPGFSHYFALRFVLLCRPYLLGQAVFVAADQASGGLYDIRAAAVIDIQNILLCVGIGLQKIPHSLRRGSPKPIDGLVIVPHYHQVILRPGQKLRQLALDAAAVLILVDQDIAAALLPDLQDIRPLVKKLQAAGKHIVKIQLLSAF